LSRVNNIGKVSVETNFELRHRESRKLVQLQRPLLQRTQHSSKGMEPYRTVKEICRHVELSYWTQRGFLAAFSYVLVLKILLIKLPTLTI